MAPKNPQEATPALREEDSSPQIEWVPHEVEEREDPVQTQIVWRNVVIFALLHLASVYGLFLIPSAKPMTWLFNYMMFLAAAVSITGGAHRLWSHRSYKARLPLRVLLMVFNFAAGQNHILEWCKDHRVHHKYSETSADPHNAKRGFFFAHVGWLLCKKHPDVIAKGKQLDFSDLYGDPVIRFQCRVYVPMMIFMTFIMPTLVPWLLWNENIYIAYFLAVARYIFSLNATWLVNSAAHMWGMKPYDKHINPSENILVAMAAVGEGFHNYHHTFPQDYATSEYGATLNITTVFINFMAKIGWAYDLKTVSKQVIDARKRRTGSLSSSSSDIPSPQPTMAASSKKL